MRSRFLLFLGPLLAAPLVAGCGSSVDAPTDDHPGSGDGGVVVDETGVSSSACSASVVIDSPSVVELRAKAPSIALTTADSGMTGEHPI